MLCFEQHCTGLTSVDKCRQMMYVDVRSDDLLLWSILNKPSWECLDVLTTPQYPQYTTEQCGTLPYNKEWSKGHNCKQEECNAILYITVWLVN